MFDLKVWKEERRRIEKEEKIEKGSFSLPAFDDECGPVVSRS